MNDKRVQPDTPSPAGRGKSGPPPRAPAPPGPPAAPAVGSSLPTILALSGAGFAVALIGIAGVVGTVIFWSSSDSDDGQLTQKKGHTVASQDGDSQPADAIQDARDDEGSVDNSAADTAGPPKPTESPPEKNSGAVDSESPESRQDNAEPESTYHGNSEETVDGGSDDTAKPPEPPRPDPFVDVDRREGFLLLPARHQGLTTRTSRPKMLAKVILAHPAELDLSLVGHERVTRDDQQIRVERSDGPEVRRWQVLLSTANLIGGETQIGTFTFQDQSLEFQWHRKAPSGVAFEFCLLQLEAGHEQRICRLAEPLEVTAPRIDFESASQSVTEPLPAGMLSLIQCLTASRELKIDMGVAGLSDEVLPAEREAASSATGYRAVAHVATPKLEGAEGVIDVSLAVDITTELQVRIQKHYHPQLLTDAGATELANWEASWEGDDGLDVLKRKCQRSREKCADAKVKRERARLHCQQELPGLQQQALLLDKQKPSYYASSTEKSNYYYQQQRMRNAISQCEALIKTHENEIQQMELRMKFCDGNLDWCEKMRSFMKDVETNGRIHLRVYYESDGREIELLRTKT